MLPKCALLGQSGRAAQGREVTSSGRGPPLKKENEEILPIYLEKVTCYRIRPS